MLAVFLSDLLPCQVPTIATLAALGHHVVAVDLPGYGKTKVSPTVLIVLTFSPDKLLILNKC
jgi:hypothetical protein